MHAENMAILKSLVSVAWADGEFGEPERQLVEAFLEAFDATPEQAAEVLAYAATQKTLEDVPVDERSPDDIRVLINHAVLLAFVDGKQDDREIAFIEKLAQHVGIPDAEARTLIESAETRALKHIGLL